MLHGALGRPRKLHGKALGFVGLGKIGSGMVGNLAQAGATIVAFDRDASALAAVAEQQESVSAAADIAEVAQRASVVLTALPNDAVLQIVVDELLPALALHSSPVHISCSTVAPSTTRALEQKHAAKGVGFVSAPVFARPDGMRRGEATIPVSGPGWAKAQALPILEKTASSVHDFGEDPGAANTVKLGGNFLIAAAIEAMAEATALAESQGVDRERFMSLMSSTIFDCLIYRGYGHRVAARDHFPYTDAHFALDLGAKDVALVQQAAVERNCPMPVASLLRDRFLTAQSLGRSGLDWSAIALRASEDSNSHEVGDAVAKLMASIGQQPTAASGDRSSSSSSSSSCGSSK